MPTIKSADLSMHQIRSDAKKSAKNFNAAWNVAAKAPCFLKKQKYVGTGKDKRVATVVDRNGVTKPTPRRTNRCLRHHAMKILLSSAIDDAAKTAEEELEEMAQEALGENKRAPALYTLSKGAQMAFEQALVAYAQSIFENANRIVENAGVHAKVTPGAMKAAAEMVNTNITRATAIAPFVFHTNLYSKPAAKKTKKAADAGKEKDGEDA